MAAGLAMFFSDHFVDQLHHFKARGFCRLQRLEDILLNLDIVFPALTQDCHHAVHIVMHFRMRFFQ